MVELSSKNGDLRLESADLRYFRHLSMPCLFQDACLSTSCTLLLSRAPNLILALFRGKIDCDQDDSKRDWDWAVLERKSLEKTRPRGCCLYAFPARIVDRPPRNPAKKISSGYKAWEYLLYIYGLGPALFYNVLPEKYWSISASSYSRFASSISEESRKINWKLLTKQ